MMIEEEIQQIYSGLGIGREVLEFGARIEKKLTDRFLAIDRRAEYNQLKVIGGMQKNRVSDIHFAATTGYGYNDLGRDTLEAVYASVFHGESALVRPQLISGTHALNIALSGNLRPGDELLSPVGKPYDTLEEVIGIRPSCGSLAEYGITYRQVDLKVQGLCYPAHPVGGAHRRTDCFHQIHPSGCNLHGGQLLRRICGDHRAYRCRGRYDCRFSD